MDPPGNLHTVSQHNKINSRSFIYDGLTNSSLCIYEKSNLKKLHP